MRYVTLAALLVVGGVGVVHLSAQTKPEQELIQLENDWCAADLKTDAAFIGRIIAADYTGVGSRGTTDTKESYLASYKDTSTKTTGCVNSNMKVRIYGDTAVVTGTMTRAGTFKGGAFKDRQLLFTDVFIRREGRWQCVASQSTLSAAQQR